MSFYAFVPGDPHGKGSVRVGKWGAYKDEKTDTYMGVAIMAMRAVLGDARPMTGPLSVRLYVWCRRPKALVPRPRQKAPPSSAPLPCVTKPDADNCAKTILDCLVQSGAIEDDKSVCELLISKRYVAVDSALGNTQVGVAVHVEVLL